MVIAYDHKKQYNTQYMDKKTLEALGDYLRQFITLRQGPSVGRILPQVFKVEGCDHSVKRTVEWLKANSRDADADMLWLKEHGGFCDCKVIINVIGRLYDEAEW